ncbi:MAG: nucleotidyltransferase family protein, partial [Bacilli bacterium]
MKKVLGLVLELNPFHNGHKYFIDQAIKMINPSVTIAVVSTSFTMRGDVSVIDKFAKTKLCLDYGIDIVLELPFISAINSADYFSAAAVNILKSFQVTDICFGSEAKSIETLQNIATISSSAEYNNILRANLDKGLSYSSASLSTLLSLTDPSLAMSSTLPNNTLGIGYLKAIKDSNITPHIIERIDNMYYDENISKTNIASATSLRKEIGENKEIDNYIPNYTYDFVNS